jgi:hypothetical protein
MRMKWRGALVLLAAAAGCDDSVAGSDVDSGSEVDTGDVDAGAVDAGAVDAGAVDAGTADAGRSDLGPVDVATPDAGPADAGAPDAGIGDVGVDAGASDAASDVPFVGADGGPSCSTAMCGGACVDTQTSLSNCGACGHVCCAGSVCREGACAIVDCGNPSLTACGPACTAAGGCFNLQTDPLHCGACDRACPAVAGANPSCATGTCGFACDAVHGDCDAAAANGCETDLATTAAHCGACGRACGAGQGCTAGVCGDLPCAGAGEVRCGGACTDRQTSLAHCGTCGNACPSAAGASATCAAGACGFTCNAGLADCDAVAANGCETDLGTAAASCGRCGAACATGMDCVSGHCERTTCLPPASTATTACTRVAFSEDWEAGTARWNLPRGGTTAITTMSDSSACAGQFLRETELYSAGRVLTQSGIPVTGGARYCVAGWIRGSAGTWPFIGMRGSTSTAALGTEHWLIGQPCFGTSLPPPVAPVISDGTWRWYAREFTMPAYTHVLLEIEIWNGGAAGTADFDQVQLLEGPCPSLAPATVCAPATCAP